MSQMSLASTAAPSATAPQSGAAHAPAHRSSWSTGAALPPQPPQPAWQPNMQVQMPSGLDSSGAAAGRQGLHHSSASVDTVSSAPHAAALQGQTTAGSTVPQSAAAGAVAAGAASAADQKAALHAHIMSLYSTPSSAPSGDHPCSLRAVRYADCTGSNAVDICLLAFACLLQELCMYGLHCTPLHYIAQGRDVPWCTRPFAAVGVHANAWLEVSAQRWCLVVQGNGCSQVAHTACPRRRQGSRGGRHKGLAGDVLWLVDFPSEVCA